MHGLSSDDPLESGGKLLGKFVSNVDDFDPFLVAAFENILADIDGELQKLILWLVWIRVATFLSFSSISCSQGQSGLIYHTLCSLLTANYLPVPVCNYFSVLFPSSCKAIGMLYQRQQRCYLCVPLVVRAQMKKWSQVQNWINLQTDYNTLVFQDWVVTGELGWKTTSEIWLLLPRVRISKLLRGTRERNNSGRCVPYCILCEVVLTTTISAKSQQWRKGAILIHVISTMIALWTWDQFSHCIFKICFRQISDELATD